MLQAPLPACALKDQLREKWRAEGVEFQSKVTLDYIIERIVSCCINKSTKILQVLAMSGLQKALSFMATA